jgi:hypothetical protein
MADVQRVSGEDGLSEVTPLGFNSEVFCLRRTSPDSRVRGESNKTGNIMSFWIYCTYGIIHDGDGDADARYCCNRSDWEILNKIWYKAIYRNGSPPDHQHRPGRNSMTNWTMNRVRYD